MTRTAATAVRRTILALAAFVALAPARAGAQPEQAGPNMVSTTRPPLVEPERAPRPSQTYVVIVESREPGIDGAAVRAALTEDLRSIFLPLIEPGVEDEPQLVFVVPLRPAPVQVSLDRGSRRYHATVEQERSPHSSSRALLQQLVAAAARLIEQSEAATLRRSGLVPWVAPRLVQVPLLPWAPELRTAPAPLPAVPRESRQEGAAGLAEPRPRSELQPPTTPPSNPARPLAYRRWL